MPAKYKHEFGLAGIFELFKLAIFCFVDGCAVVLGCLTFETFVPEATRCSLALACPTDRTVIVGIPVIALTTSDSFTFLSRLLSVCGGVGVFR